MLIQSLQPPYLVRFNQVQSIFLLAVADEEFASENLQQLIQSDSNLFDILPQFFYHRNSCVRRAALEVILFIFTFVYELTVFVYRFISDVLTQLTPYLA